jgi:hypothetical protein
VIWDVLAGFGTGYLIIWDFFLGIRIGLCTWDLCHFLFFIFEKRKILSRLLISLSRKVVTCEVGIFYFFFG